MSVVVIGSLNIDHILHVPRFPLVGETLHSSRYGLGPGGKGFNQCVSVRRLISSNHEVVMYGRTGNDDGGRLFERLMAEEKIVNKVEKIDSTSTGAAFVSVDLQGRNNIVLHGGANMTFGPNKLDCSIFAGAACVVMQLEIPIITVHEIAKAAQGTNTKVVLNPAPYQTLPQGLLELCDYLILNETEIAQMTAGSSIWARATKLLDAGVKKAVIVTQGSNATVAVLREGNASRVVELMPPSVPNPTDTTGAGDAFIGAFVARMVETNFEAPMETAIRFANKAASITVTRSGASTSIPTRAEVEASQ